MKKSIRDWLPSESDCSTAATQFATELAIALDDGDETAANALLAQLGAAQRDPLGKLMEYVEGIFKRDLGWDAPDWTEDRSTPTNDARTYLDAIREAAEKVQNGEMQLQTFKRGTASLLQTHLRLSTSALVAVFTAHHKLTQAMALRDTCPEKAIDELASGALCLIQMYVWRARQPRARGAASKLARDPKQSAKAKAFKLWQERRAGKHPDLRWNWQFANECVRRWPKLTSPDTVKGWCTKWEKEARKKNHPAS